MRRHDRQILPEGARAPARAALVKTTLINVSRNLVGKYVPSEAGSLPNLSEGFGRVDLAMTVGPYTAGTSLITRDENTELDLIVRAANGQERHGNMPANSASFDRNNNIEQVSGKTSLLAIVRSSFERTESPSIHKVTLWWYALLAGTERTAISC